MAGVKGELTVTAGGKDYRLHLGMSALADLQENHGNDFLAKLQPPADAPQGWMPPLRVIVDVVRVSLDRYHADDLAENRRLHDDILAEVPDVFARLLAAAFPDVASGGNDAGNVTGPKAAA